MIYLRSLLYLIAMAVATVGFGLTVAFTGRILSWERRSAISNAWGTTNLWLLRVICGLRYRLTG